jgi:isoleucyl-tRNA synthetase
VLRYWVAGTDYANDVPCSDAILKQFGESYRNIRNALRFLIGNLKGFHPDQAPATLQKVDEWVIEQVELLSDDCVAAYERFDFGSAISSVHNFCRQQLSSFYLDAIKDRMYCDGDEWESRRSGQYACFVVSQHLIKLIAPVLVHTAEEAWKKMHETVGVPTDSVHLQTFGAPSAERLSEIEASELQILFAKLQSAKQLINGAFELFKGTDCIKNSQEVVANLSIDAESKAMLEQFPLSELANYFKVSWVVLSEGSEAVTFERSPYNECIRSRVRRPDVESVTIEGEEFYLSKRDREALNI